MANSTIKMTYRQKKRQLRKQYNLYRLERAKAKDRDDTAIRDLTRQVESVLQSWADKTYVLNRPVHIPALNLDGIICGFSCTWDDRVKVDVNGHVYAGSYEQIDIKG